MEARLIEITMSRRPVPLTRIDDNRQVRGFFNRRNRRQIEGESRAWFKGADAALAEHHAFVAARQKILGGFEPLSMVELSPALEQKRRARLADFRAADRSSAYCARRFARRRRILQTCSTRAGVITSVMMGQTGFGAGASQNLQALQTQTLEIVGRSARLEGAATQNLRGQLS